MFIDVIPILCQDLRKKAAKALIFYREHLYALAKRLSATRCANNVDQRFPAKYCPYLMYKYYL